MALRFRKSFKLAPGVRMNLSGGGFSWSVGPRGASIGIGKRGAYLNTGIPGTGLSSRTRIDGSNSRPKRQIATQSNSISLEIAITVDDDGTISFKDSFGNPLTEKMINLAKRQHGDAIRNLIQQKCDEINNEIDALGQIHLQTTSLNEVPFYTARPFNLDVPIKPSLIQLGFIKKLFKKFRDETDAANIQALLEYDQILKNWHSQKDSFDAEEKERKNLIQEKIYTDISSMEIFLEDILKDINWPQETNVSFEIFNNGTVIFIDVDLPEIEDLPRNKANAPTRNYKLTVKELSDTNIQKLYMQHIHGIAFRTIGEVFWALPKSGKIIFSGYSQRPDKATGQITDEYLLSTCVKRTEWEEINFNNLENLDVIEALSRFDFRRNMTKTGIFKPIIPFNTEELVN